MSLTAGFLSDLREFLIAEPRTTHMIVHELRELGRPFLLRSDLHDVFEAVCAHEDSCELTGSPVARLIDWAQEAAIDGSRLYVAARHGVARWSHLRLQLEPLDVAEVPVVEFLAAKERLVDGRGDGDWTLEVDLAPFSREFTKLKEARSIGRGVEFMNRNLASSLFDKRGRGHHLLLDFLRVHRWGEQQLMLTRTVDDIDKLRNALRTADRRLAGIPGETPWLELAQDLHGLGFEPGWGRDADRVRESMQLLLDLLEAPSHDALETFLSRVPMVFSICILSPHGWFGQQDVLGRPDTGGQVVYILDQVRALEEEMSARLARQGLDISPQILVVTRQIPDAQGTTCDQRLEPIAGTQHARILRVPFREADGTVVPHWISRFDIWPYLERYTGDVEREVVAELQGRPDLIIGNYSDGNLVASLLSSRLGVTHCTIAHALEKTKYLLSDLYWRENEAQHHFSCQFTADLIAMNTADFIITSTYQEIAGTEDTVGQYEAHTSFTMPGLYRVVNGIDVFDPKFNIVSPGVDPAVYFPPGDQERRLRHLLPDIERQVYGPPTDGESRGEIEDPDRPLLFTMARMDRVKNLTGFIDWYGRSDALRRTANVLVAGGYLDPGRSGDEDEKREIEKMHRLLDEHELDGEVRWLVGQVDRERNGELYRFVADRRGAFVQPALFEAFGLTVIEAMSTGLPTFATCFGGPLEIIVDGKSGFHIDPNHGERATERMATFFRHCAEDPGVWDRIAQGALDRVAERYTWARYADRLMTLSKIYGFWRHATNLERAETHRYLEMFYGLQFRPLAARISDRPH
jgi:sucrose synthase